MTKQKKTNNKGFSLVELIVVIAIMAVLIGVLAPTVISNIEKSRESKDLSYLDTVYTAIQTAYGDEAGNKVAPTAITKINDVVVTEANKDADTTDAFEKLVSEYLGYEVASPNSTTAEGADGIYFQISGTGKISVWYGSNTASGFVTGNKNGKDFIVE